MIKLSHSQERFMGLKETSLFLQSSFRELPEEESAVGKFLSHPWHQLVKWLL